MTVMLDDSLSWSRLRAYLGCPKAFEFRYVRGEAPAFTASSLVLGGAVHDLVAQHHIDLLCGEDSSQIDAASFITSCFEDADPVVRFGAREDPGQLAEVGAAMTHAILEASIVESGLSIAGVEERFEAEVVDGLPPVVGVIDLMLTDADGNLTLIDFKTTRSNWSASKLKEQAGQLLLYGQMLERKGETVGSLRFVTVTKALDAKVTTLTVDSSVERREAMLEQLRMVWRGIEAGAFPANPGWQCSGCPFSDRCDSAAV